MKTGYNKKSISANIAELMDSGDDLRKATAKALSYARVCYFRKHPGGALPLHLAYPKANRLKQYYDDRGMPLIANPRNRKALQKDAQLIESFTGHKAEVFKKVTLPPPAKTGIAIGEVIGIIYRTLREPENYIHRFRKKSRPLLAATHGGKQLILLGGAYLFTDRGIVDK